jgi:predicted PolB exonuclease-like 3'-5' exonuclease
MGKPQNRKANMITEHFEAMQVFQDELEEWLEDNFDSDPAIVLNFWAIDPFYMKDLTFEEIASNAMENYMGNYASLYDFAQEISAQYIEETPPAMRPYLDLEALGRDLLMNDFQENNGYYYTL